MAKIRILSAAALTLAGLTVYAQDFAPAQPAPFSKPAPSAQAVNTADCAAARKARHDHGIERGYGPMPTKGCGAMTTARTGEKAIAGHDHGKFQKNQ